MEKFICVLYEVSSRVAAGGLISSELLRRRTLEGSPPTISEVLLPLFEVL